MYFLACGVLHSSFLVRVFQVFVFFFPSGWNFFFFSYFFFCMYKPFQRQKHPKIQLQIQWQGILGEAQGGFRKERQTVDQLFVVNGVTQLRRSEGKNNWLAFLDLRKAFPSVWREGLWRKMEDYGIGGKFLRVCQNMYSNTRARVKLGGSSLYILW